MINEVLTKLPEIVANLFDIILVVNKDINELYDIKYDGKKLSIKNKTTYDNISNYLDNEEIVLLDQENSIINEKHNIKIHNQDNYKFIFICNKVKDNIDNEKGTLLIADDSPVITNFFKKIFEDNYNVLVAKDGNEAIKLIEKYRNDNLLGVFLDLSMPISSGFDVLEYFKEHNLFKEIPVSIISGDDSQEGISKATSYEIVDMLQKPFSKERAEAIVNKTISFSPKNN